MILVDLKLFRIIDLTHERSEKFSLRWNLLKQFSSDTFRRA